MKNHLLWGFFIFCIFFGFSSFLGAQGIIKQYSNYSTKHPWVAFGANYALFAQTNNYGPTKTSADGLDIFLEINLTRFLSLYTGYQFMEYDWKSRPDTLTLVNHKMLLGVRLYLGGIFLGGGGYSNWTTMKGLASGDVKDNYWGGYIDFGYQYYIIQDFLSIQTGGRIYFTPNKVSKMTSPYYTNNVPKNGDGFFHWDWFIGAKIFI